MQNITTSQRQRNVKAKANSNYVFSCFLEGQIPVRPSLQECPNQKYLSFFTGPQSCGMLATPDSAHASGHDTVDPSVFIASCVAAACKARGSYLDVLESTLYGYHIVCAVRGTRYEYKAIADQRGAYCQILCLSKQATSKAIGHPTNK